MKKRCSLLLASALAISSPALAQTMDAGEWEFTTTVNSPSMPEPQTAKILQCMSKEDAADPTRFATNDTTQGCVVKQVARATGSYEWQVSCPPQGLTGDGKLRYTRTTLNAEIRLKVEMDDKKVDTTSRISARRMGPCKTK
jgi:hypothetical protein